MFSHHCSPCYMLFKIQPAKPPWMPPTQILSPFCANFWRCIHSFKASSYYFLLPLRVVSLSGHPPLWTISSVRKGPFFRVPPSLAITDHIWFPDHVRLPHLHLSMLLPPPGIPFFHTHPPPHVCLVNFLAPLLIPCDLTDFCH